MSVFKILTSLGGKNLLSSFLQLTFFISSLLRQLPYHVRLRTTSPSQRYLFSSLIQIGLAIQAIYYWRFCNSEDQIKRLMLRHLIPANSCHVQCLGTRALSSAVHPLPWLFVGLGNPGHKFIGTRHNVGFEMVDAFADALGISLSTVHCKALFGQGFAANVPVFLAKPQTYMNLSGESTGSLAAYYKMPLDRVMVFHDDMELPCGVLRIQPKGGHGSHNGLKSMIEHFRGNREFARLRIGIGRPPGQMDPKAFLLQKFNYLARERIDAALKEGVDMLKLVPTEGLAECARWFNREQKYKHIQTTVIRLEGEEKHPGT